GSRLAERVAGAPLPGARGHPAAARLVHLLEHPFRRSHLRSHAPPLLGVGLQGPAAAAPAAEPRTYSCTVRAASVRAPRVHRGPAAARQLAVLRRERDPA